MKKFSFLLLFFISILYVAANSGLHNIQIHSGITIKMYLKCTIIRLAIITCHTLTLFLRELPH